jgi:dipeptidyl aminopeptidase/acylaminoacyl peptidase
VPAGRLSRPARLDVLVAGGRTVTVLLYPPGGVSGAAGWSAPLIVRAHPGPTSSMNLRLDWHAQFLASHGFAVADVDYAGSSGYGRAFRQSLYGRWGTADVDDCAAVACHLVTAGRARPDQVFIYGASAGGYTALQAVSRPGPFAGAVARAAIVDPERWQHTAPRWQRPHARRLGGAAGPVRAASVDRPVLLIHGADDAIAPVADVVALADALAVAGKRHRLLVLGASGHQRSREQEDAEALGTEIAFYRSVMRP